MIIPRIFHRIWLGNRPMPPEFKAFGRSWLRLHPGWKMKLWTDANMPPLANRWAFDHSRSLSGKSNLLRYEILLRFGGVYVDTDFECLRNLEPLIGELECFAGQHREETFEHGAYAVINTALLGAVPGHAFIRDLVEEAEANMRGVIDDTDISVYQTGPVFLTNVIQRHPEVCIFAPRVFYPYGPRERWRRYERFPHAYAAHHWTLNALSALQRKPRRLGRGGKPCLSIVLHPAKGCDALRLRWVLEGLAAQWVDDFEVLAWGGAPSASLRRVYAGFRGRLKIRHLTLPAGKRPRNGSAWRRNLATRRALAPRVLFLDADCMPDPDVVGKHAAYGGRPVLMYGYRRTYPRAKLFPFRDTIDYGSIIRNSRLGPSLYIVPSSSRWREANGFCFSAPKALILSAGGFSENLPANEVRGLARRLARSGCPTLPSLTGATVTRMGTAGR
jgi:hypothetical protein